MDISKENFGESLCINVTPGGGPHRMYVADTDPIKCFWILPVAMGAFRNRTRERKNRFTRGRKRSIKIFLSGVAAKVPTLSLLFLYSFLFSTTHT